MKIATMNRYNDGVKEEKIIGFTVILSLDEAKNHPEGISLSKEEWMKLINDSEVTGESFEEMLRRFESLPFEAKRMFIRALEENLNLEMVVR